MKRDIRFAGLDVHAETIAVAVAEPDGQVRSLGIIPIRPQAVAKATRLPLGSPANGSLSGREGPDRQAP